MKNILFSCCMLMLFSACEQREEVDLIVSNAKVYTVNDAFDVVKGFAVKDGKIVALGGYEDLRLQYKAKQSFDAKGKAIYPGFIDAHAHFYNLGMQQQRVELTGTKSFDEVLERLKAFQEQEQRPFIIGRGWDQNDWPKKEFPTNKALDDLFPDTPVVLTRIDGHALLANTKALQLANLNADTQIPGGQLLKHQGELTGVLIDNAMQPVQAIIPEPSRATQIDALLAAQKIAFENGLTSIADAGLNKNKIELIDSLQQAEVLKVRLYAMLANNAEEIDYFLERGPLKTDFLNLRSVKVFADGALGSRGAALKQPYSDKKGHYGSMLIGIADFKALAQKLSQSSWQMNTHAIGDSANAVVLSTYKNLLKDKANRRWRVEHAQVVAPQDFKYFNKNIIPSVQPTHATSDMYWAKDRLGEKRLQNAYAYKKLLEAAGLVALGTDFPIEKVNPMLTFYAAVARKDLENYPTNGFQKAQALTREEALKGMTIWAAYANFEEQEKGSIAVGKFADFVVLNQDLLKVSEQQLPLTRVLATYVNGEKVY